MATVLRKVMGVSVWVMPEERVLEKKNQTHDKPKLVPPSSFLSKQAETLLPNFLAAEELRAGT